MRNIFMLFIASLTTLVLGLFLVGLGLIIAIFAGADWLYLSLIGLLLATIAGYAIYMLTKYLKKIGSSLKRLRVKAKVK
ncbi:MAG TPA: hypothetical protein VFZ58_05715 [Candidatus Saccharimonadales bacterium]